MPKKRRCKRSTQMATGVFRGREVDFMVTLPCGIKKVRPVDIERMADKLPNRSKQRLIDEPDLCKVSFIKADAPVVFCEGGPGRRAKPKGVVPSGFGPWKIPKGKKSAARWKAIMRERCLTRAKGKFKRISKKRCTPSL